MSQPRTRRSRPRQRGIERLVLACVLAAAWSPAPAMGQALERELYVSVLAKDGKPVTDATAADLTVREDGVAREILRMRPASAPMQIALLVDTSQAATDAVSDMRRALHGFVDRMHERHQIAVISFGERPKILTDYTHDRVQLSAGVDKIFSMQSSGAYLLDALVETLRGFEKRGAARPVIIAISEMGPEFSSPHYDQVLKPLGAAGAALHTIVLGPDSPSLDDGARNRSTVIDRGTRQSGGRRENVLANSALPDRLLELAAELDAQYLVTYARPQSLIPPEKIEVTAARAGLTVRGTPIKTKTVQGQ